MWSTMKMGRDAGATDIWVRWEHEKDIIAWFTMPPKAFLPDILMSRERR